MGVSRTTAAGLAVGLIFPCRALAHGGEALIVGLCLPAAVVPVVFVSFLLVSWVRGVVVGSMARTGLGVCGAAVAGVAFDYTLLHASTPPGPSGDGIVAILWWAVPIALAVIAWVVAVRWARAKVPAVR